MVDQGSAARFGARFPIPGTIEVADSETLLPGRVVVDSLLELLGSLSIPISIPTTALDPSAGSNVIPSSLSSALFSDCFAPRQNLICVRHLTAAITAEMKSRHNNTERLAMAKAGGADGPSASRFGDGGSGGSWHTVQTGRQPIIASHRTCPSSLKMLTPSSFVPLDRLRRSPLD